MDEIIGGVSSGNSNFVLLPRKNSVGYRMATHYFELNNEVITLISFYLCDSLTVPTLSR